MMPEENVQSPKTAKGMKANLPPKVKHHAPVVVGGYKIVSAGKTRELNFFKVNNQFFLVDLPGVGFAKVSNSKRDQMSDFIRDYVEKCQDLKGLVYLVDVRHGGHAIDVETVENIRASGCPVLIVASKRDKANQSELAKGLRSIREKFGLEQNPLSVSSLKKFGLDALWQNILEALGVTGQENV